MRIRLLILAFVSWLLAGLAAAHMVFAASLVANVPLVGTMTDSVGGLSSGTVSRESDLITVKNGIASLYRGDGENLIPAAAREDLNDSSWSKARVTIDGTSGIIASTDYGQHYVRNNSVSVSDDITYILSAKVKPAGQHWVEIRGGEGGYLNFDLNNQVFGLSGPRVISYGYEPADSDGYYRVYVTYTGQSSSSWVAIYPELGDNNDSYTGDGVTVELYIKEVQLEEVVNNDYEISTEADYDTITGSFYDGQSWITAEKLGPELITNGDFTNWTGDDPDNWSIYGTEDSNNYITESSGKCRIVSDGTGIGIIQNIMILNAVNKIELDITEVVSGQIQITNDVVGGFIEILGSVGHHVIYVPADKAISTRFRIKRNSACDVTIDNVSVKEVTASIADYQDTAYMVEVSDGTNKAWGWAGRVGSGEAWGSELVTNGGFDTDTSGWMIESSTIASVAGGVDGNALEITADGSSQYAYGEQWITTELYKQYRGEAWLKLGTDANSISFTFWNAATGHLVFGTSTNTEWQVRSDYITTVVTSSRISIWAYGDSPYNHVGYADEVSVKEVTEPDVTSVHIYKSPALEEEGFEIIEDGFDPNSITTLTVIDNKHSTLQPRAYSGTSTDTIPAEMAYTDKGGFNPVAATNLLLKNRALDESPWVNTDISLSSDISDISLLYNGYTISSYSETNPWVNIHQSILKSTSDTSVYTASVFVKKDDNTPDSLPAFYIRFGNVSPVGYRIVLDTTDGSVLVDIDTALDTSYVVVGDGDWWHIELTAADNNANDMVEFYVYPAVYSDINGSPDATATGSVAVCYPQLFKLPYDPQVIIPTDDSPVSVTNQVTSWTEESSLITALGSSGTLICKLTPYYDETDGPSGNINILSTDGNVASILYYDHTNNLLKATDGTNTASVAYTPEAGTEAYAAVRWDTGSLKVSVYDSSSWTHGTDAGAFAGFPTTGSTMYFSDDSNRPLSARYIMIYDEALSDTLVENWQTGGGGHMLLLGVQ